MNQNTNAESGSLSPFSDLLADGWREYPNQFKKYARCFYKRFQTPTRCFGNDDKPGIQIQISVSDCGTMELELCAGLKDETWLTIHNYALPSTVKEVTALIPRMLAVWESANDKLSHDTTDIQTTETRRNGEAQRRCAPVICSASVLDVCCGSRMMWYDKSDNRAVYVDKRRETWAADLGTESTKGRTPIVVNPDIVADFTDLPFPSNSFAHVVFDPPHIEQLEETAGLLTKKYGSLVGDWREMLRAGFTECFRVLTPGGTLIFKWNSVNIPLREILALTPEKPLYGHRSGKKATTHWCAFLKPNK